MGLVLKRRLGESVKIGDDVTVTVVSCTSSVVKLQIDAPADVDVWRSEIEPAPARAFTGDESMCARIMVGQGGDTFDPVCSLPVGHEPPCKSSAATTIAGRT